MEMTPSSAVFLEYNLKLQTSRAGGREGSFFGKRDGMVAV